MQKNKSLPIIYSPRKELALSSSFVLTHTLQFDASLQMPLSKSIRITNLSSNSMRFKVKKAPEPPFRVSAFSVKVAPGMSAELCVSLQEGLVGKSVLVIQSENLQMKQVSLIAIRRLFSLESLPPVKCLQINRPVIVDLKLASLTHQPIVLSLQPFLSEFISLTPYAENITLLPLSKAAVSLEVSCFSAGRQQGRVKVWSGNFIEEAQISVNCFQFERTLLHKGKVLQQLNLGVLNQYEKRVVAVCLVNNSPQRLNGRILIHNLRNRHSLSEPITPQRLGQELSQHELQVTPQYVDLSSFSETQLTLKWLARNLSDQSSHRQYMVIVQALNKSFILKFMVRAQIVRPQISLSTKSVQFDYCVVHQAQQRIINMKNSGVKAVYIEFMRDSLVQISPRELRIESGAVKSVSFTVKPKLVGRFQTIVGYSIEHTQNQFMIPVEGKAFMILDKSLKRNTSACSHFSNSLSLSSIQVRSLKSKRAPSPFSLQQLKLLDQINSSRQVPLNPDFQLRMNPIPKERLAKVSDLSISSLDTSRPTVKPKQESFIEMREARKLGVDQKRLVKLKLQPHQLKLIQLQTSFVQFGKVFWKSELCRKLVFTNRTATLIGVSLLPHAAFPKLDCRGKAVEGGRSGEFLIRYECKELGSFSFNLQYRVNQTHQFSIRVDLEVIPPQLALSLNQLRFDLPERSLEFSQSKTLKFRNTGNSQVNYRLKTHNSLFMASKSQGSIAPQQEDQITVTFSSQGVNEGTSLQDKIRVIVQDGLQQPVYCRAILNLSEVRFQRKTPLCLELRCNQSAAIVFVLTNLRKIATPFKVTNLGKLQNYLGESQLLDLLEASQSRTVTLKLSIPGQMQLRQSVRVETRGGSSFQMQVQIRVLLPQVRFVCEQVSDLGEIPLNSVTTLKFQIQNKSPVPVQLLHLAAPSPLSFQVQIQQQALSQLLQGQTYPLPPCSSVKCRVRLTPEVEGAGCADIPVVVKGFHPKIKQCLRKIKYQALQQKISISPLQVDLSCFLDSNFFNTNKLGNLTITNSSDSPLLWRFSNLSQLEHFTLLTSSGLIPPHQKIRISVQFTPRRAGVLQQSLKFHSERSGQQPLKLISLRGKAQYSYLQFSTKQLVMPISIPGQEVFGFFQIINNGYENLKLNWTADLPPHLTLQIDFGELPILGIQHPKAQGRLTIKSKISKSYSFQVIFNDMYREFSFSVSGSCDSSIITIQPMLLNSHLLPLIYNSTVNIDQYYRQSANELLLFLNGFVLLKRKLKEFPWSLLSESECLKEFSQFFTESGEREGEIGSFRTLKTIASDSSYYINRLINYLTRSKASIGHISTALLLQQEVEEKLKSQRLKLWVQFVYQLLNSKWLRNLTLKTQDFHFKNKNIFSSSEIALLKQVVVLQKKWVKEPYQPEQILQNYVSELKVESALKQLTKNFMSHGQEPAQQGVRKIVQEVGVTYFLGSFDKSTIRGRMLLLAVMFSSLGQIKQKQISPLITAISKPIHKQVIVPNNQKRTLRLLVSLHSSPCFALSRLHQLLLSPESKAELTLTYACPFKRTNEQAFVLFLDKRLCKTLPATLIKFSASTDQTICGGQGVVGQTCVNESLQIKVLIKNLFDYNSAFKLNLQEGSNSFKLMSHFIKLQSGAAQFVSVQFSPSRVSIEKCIISATSQQGQELLFQVRGVGLPQPPRKLFPEILQNLTLDLDVLFQLDLTQDVQAGSSKRQLKIRLTEHQPLVASYPQSLTFLRGQRCVLPLPIKPRNSANGIFQVLVSETSGQEIRRYELGYNVAGPNQIVKLYFCAQLDSETIQYITLFNKADEEALFKLDLLDPHKVFQASCEPLVGAGKPTKLLLVFRPRSLGKFEGRVQVSNRLLHQQITLELIGYGIQETGNQLRIQAEAGQTTQFDMPVNNPTADRIQLKVLIDNQAVSAKSSLLLQPDSVSHFPLTIAPRFIGQYKGTITFKRGSQRWLKRRLLVDSSKSSPAREIKLQGSCKQRVSFSHILRNSRIEREQFQIESESDLIQYPKEVVVQGLSQVSVQFYVTLLKDDTQIRLYFKSQTVEFFFILHLSVAQEVIRLPLLKTNIGQTSSLTFTLANPSLRPVNYSCVQLHSSLKLSTPSRFDLGSKEQRTLKLIFSPAVFMDIVSEILFESKQLQRTKVILSLKSQLLIRDCQHRFELCLGSQLETFLYILNPFPYEVRIELDTPSQEFLLGLHQTKLNPNASINIPLKFVPVFNKTYEALVSVLIIPNNIAIKHKLVALVSNTLEPRKISGSCYEFIAQSLQVTLTGLQDQQEQVEIDFQNHNKIFILKEVRLSKRKLFLAFQVRSQRPIEHTVQLRIKGSKGGCWLLPVELKIRNFKVEGQLQIIAKLNESKSTTLILENKHIHSDSDFRVELSDSSYVITSWLVLGLPSARPLLEAAGAQDILLSLLVQKNIFMHTHFLNQRESEEIQSARKIASLPASAEKFATAKGEEGREWVINPELVNRTNQKSSWRERWFKGGNPFFIILINGKRGKDQGGQEAH